MAKKEVKLGHTVRDMVTGFTGIATQLVELLSGTVQFAVQPKLGAKATPGDYPNGMNLDIQTLEFVDDGVAKTVIPPAVTELVLGNEVEDILTGFKGTLTSKNTFINGCVYFHVLPKMTKEQKEQNKAPDSEFFDHARLKKISDGVVKKAAVTLEKPVAQRTGGPATRMSRI